jgi:pimeloyl-ACP methyl ester carboxylesterase
VVFLHNAGAQRRIWDGQVAALSDEHEIFALDLPGYGRSDQPATGYRLTDYVDMLTAFLDTHDRTDVVLVGNCLGSATSLRYAMDRPDRVRALVLINPLTWDTVSSGQSAGLAWLDARLPLAPLARRISLPGPVVSLIVGNQLGPRGSGPTAAERRQSAAAVGQSSGKLAERTPHPAHSNVMPISSIH